jgi:hypothetical protein
MGTHETAGITKIPLTLQIAEMLAVTYIEMN